MKNWLCFLLLAAVMFSGCDTKTDDELNDDVKNKQTQTPRIGNQDYSTQQKIEVMTVFTPEQSKVKELVTGVIYKNLEATQAEDYEGVMETIHEDSPQRSSTEKGMDYVFKNFDMVYEMEDIKFVSISDEIVEVLYQQTTKSVKGGGFRNTRAVGLHTLKKSKDGNWKIYKTDNINTQPLQ